MLWANRGRRVPITKQQRLVRDTRLGFEFAMAFLEGVRAA